MQRKIQKDNPENSSLNASVEAKPSKQVLAKQENEQQVLSQSQENERRNFQEVRTNYPHSKRQIFNMFKGKNQGSYRTYDIQQAKKILKDQLLNMSEYGYDFIIKEWTFKETRRRRRKYWKQMRRKIYVKNQCRNCTEESKNSDKKGKGPADKTWTSILGCGQIKFKVSNLEDFLQKYSYFRRPNDQIQKMEYPKIVQWEMKFYREKCKKCLKFGKTFIYESQMKALAMSFCWIIAQILQGVKAPKKIRDDRHKINQEMHKHEEYLCEACMEGKCFNIPK